MADNLVTQELPKVVKPKPLPTKGQIGMQEALGTSEPFLQEKARLLPKITEAKGAVETAKQEQQVTGLAGEAKAAEQFVTEEKGAQEAYQQKLEAEPLPAFIPTKDNAKDIAGLFSLVSVIGMLVGGGGKQNAMLAMNSMNGMLEGYQKGRADLYKKEAIEFDKNFKAMLQKHAEFRKEMEDAVKLAATNKEAGVANARLAAAKAGSNIVKTMLDQGRLVEAYKLVDESQKGAESALKLEAKVRSDAAKEAAAERRQRESLAARERQHQETLASQEKRATRGGSSQETALRVMQQDIGNAKYNLEDLKSLSQKEGKLPGGSVAFAQKFTGDVTSMVLRYAANQEIDEGLQGKDALMLNLAFDIASAQSGGRGQLSDAKVRAVVSQMPLDEQPESTKATKWAALMTRVDEANKTLPKEKQVEIPESLNKYYMGSRASSTPSETEKDEKGSFHYEYNQDRSKRRKVYD
jgi:hypothetical protein